MSRNETYLYKTGLRFIFCLCYSSYKQFYHQILSFFSDTRDKSINVQYRSFCFLLYGASTIGPRIRAAVTENESTAKRSDLRRRVCCDIDTNSCKLCLEDSVGFPNIQPIGVGFTCWDQCSSLSISSWMLHIAFPTHVWLEYVLCSCPRSEEQSRYQLKLDHYQNKHYFIREHVIVFVHL